MRLKHPTGLNLISRELVDRSKRIHKLTTQSWSFEDSDKANNDRLRAVSDVSLTGDHSVSPARRKAKL